MKKVCALLLSIMCVSCIFLAGCRSDKDVIKETPSIPAWLSGETKEENTNEVPEYVITTISELSASLEDVKQQITDYYYNDPSNYDDSGKIRIANFEITDVKELEKNRFRVSGSYDWYSNVWGPSWDNKQFSLYVTFYPESGNYDVTYW